jgi:hypothetical protein
MQTSSFLRLQPWVGTSEISNNPCMLMLPIDVCRLGSRWPLLSPARSLAPDEVDPFGSVWAPDRGRTATNIYRFCSDAVPCRPSVCLCQSVSRLQLQPRVLLSHAERTRGPPASGAAADTDRWLVLRYDTLRYEYPFFCFVLKKCCTISCLEERLLIPWHAPRYFFFFPSFWFSFSFTQQRAAVSVSIDHTHLSRADMK